MLTVGLQSTRLGMYIEDRVNKYLKRQNHPEAGEVFVRVVASSDKTVEVKPGMKARWEHHWGLSNNIYDLLIKCFLSKTNAVSGNRLISLCLLFYFIIYQLKCPWSHKLNNQRANCRGHNVIDDLSSCLWFVDVAVQLIFVLSLFFIDPALQSWMASMKLFIPTQSDCKTCMFNKMAYTPSLSTSEACSVFSWHKIKVCDARPVLAGRRPFREEPVIVRSNDSRLLDFNCPIMLSDFR